MTGFAQIGGIRMVARFTSSNGSIMATDTGSDYLRVIDVARRNRCPVGRVNHMTGITKICRINVVSMLTGCIHSVVTVNTVTHKTGVINRSRQPARSTMTAIAFQSRRNMVSRFANGNYVVVTT